MFGFGENPAVGNVSQIINDASGRYKIRRSIVGGLYSVQINILKQTEDFTVNLFDDPDSNMEFHTCHRFITGNITVGTGAVAPVDIEVFNVLTDNTTESIAKNNIFGRSSWHSYANDSGDVVEYFTSQGALCDIATNGVPQFIYTKPSSGGSTDNKSFYVFNGVIVYN